jgi:hypothetical protein
MGTRANGIFIANEKGTGWHRTRWSGGAGFDAAGARVVPDPRNPTIAYAWNTRGVSRTIDNGAHWERVVFLDSPIAGVAVSPRNRSVYAWRGREFFVSRDNATTWRRLTPLPPSRT